MTLRRSTIFAIEPRLKDIIKNIDTRNNAKSRKNIGKPVLPPMKQSKITHHGKINFSISQVYQHIDEPLPALSFDEMFDEIAQSLLEQPDNIALETGFRRLFKTKTAIVWKYETEKNIFYAPSYRKSVVAGSGIMGEVFRVGSYIHAPVQSEHEKFNASNDGALVPAQNNVLVFPIDGENGSIAYVVQISLGQHATSPFTEYEFKTATRLIEKFKIYGSTLFNRFNTQNISDSLKISQRSAEVVCETFAKYFQCGTVFFIVYRPKTQQYLRITKDSDSENKDFLQPDALGFSTDSFTRLTAINVPDVTQAEHYLPEVDGVDQVAALSMPFVDENEFTWVCILKSPKGKATFSALDENRLQVTIPFACRALSFLFSPKSLDDEIDHFETRLKSLLEVAEILSGVLDIETLLPTIMNHATKLLSCERCSLFLVDAAHNELVTRFHGGLSNAIRVKIGRGIVGSCAQTGDIVNIKDAYADSRFDRSVDLATGFTTRSLLCIPIYNNRGEITGVTEMINKLNDGLFDDDDIKMLMAFNVFCGISIDNARLYKASLDLTRQLRSFIEMTTSLNTTANSLNKILEEILQNIQGIVNASRVTLFMVDEVDNTLKEEMNVGEAQKYGTMFANETIQNRKFMLFDHKEVLGHTQTQQLNAAIDRILAAGLDADLLVFGEDEAGEYAEEEEFYAEDEMSAPPMSNFSAINANLQANLKNGMATGGGFQPFGNGSPRPLIDGPPEDVPVNNFGVPYIQSKNSNLIAADPNTIGEDMAVLSSVEYDAEEDGQEKQQMQKGEKNNSPEKSHVQFPDEQSSSNNNMQSSDSTTNTTTNNKSASNSQGLVPDDEEEDKEGSNEVICCLPLMSSEAATLGVIEISCNWKILSEDVKLLECFSVFASVSIERFRMKEVATLGEAASEMKSWIADNELQLTNKIPAKLTISMSKLSSVLMVKFNAPDWDGIGLIKVCYAIFDIFDINQTFGVTNEKLYRFLSEIRDNYKKVPYHNWRHAVDVMQFVAFEILVSGCNTVLSKFEIFAILVACLCHDVGHDGFTNAFNEKAETPLGLLFKNQSVMETHHCSVSIGILSKEECNIFSKLSPPEYKNMWILIIRLILATDMAKHFDIIKDVNQRVDNGEFDLQKNENDRYSFLEILIKCGDVSNVSRPFELANKWCDVLCEEFFRQGDLEQASGMEYTSPLNDRAHLDKPKSQIGFYNAVCLPLFQTAAKIMPKLQCNVDQVQSNLAQWKAEIESKQ